MTRFLKCKVIQLLNTRGSRSGNFPSREIEEHSLTVISDKRLNIKTHQQFIIKVSYINI